MVYGFYFPCAEVPVGIVKVDGFEKFARILLAGEHFGNCTHDFVFQHGDHCVEFRFLGIRVFFTQYVFFALPVESRRVDVVCEVESVVGNVSEYRGDVGTAQYPSDRPHEGRCRIEVATERIGIVVRCRHGIFSRVERIVHGESPHA